MIEINKEYEELITQAFTHGNGIATFTPEVLAYYTKKYKYILPIGTLIVYNKYTLNHITNKVEVIGTKLGVIAGDDRDNSEEDLSDLNYYVITPETNWCWDQNDMIHFEEIVAVQGSANPIVTYAKERKQMPDFLIPGEAKF